MVKERFGYKGWKLIFKVELNNIFDVFFCFHTLPLKKSNYNHQCVSYANCLKTLLFFNCEFFILWVFLRIAIFENISIVCKCVCYFFMDIFQNLSKSFLIIVIVIIQFKKSTKKSLNIFRTTYACR